MDAAPTKLFGGILAGLISPSAAQPAPRGPEMFVSEVTHTFDPGSKIGEQFPTIRALYQGEEITAVDQFIRDKGAVFIAIRSVDW